LTDLGERQYELKQESLVSFLRRFFAEQALRLVISDKLQADARTLNGRRQGTPEEILASIADSNGLVAYFDGTSVYVYSDEEVGHRYITVPSERAAELEEAIGRLQLSDYNNYTLVNRSTGLVEVIGVPRYMAQIHKLAEVVALRE